MTEWPVESQEVAGPRDGLGAHLEDLLVQATMGVMIRLPVRARELCVSCIARLARRFDRRHTQAARVFLQQALGPLGREEEDRRVLQAWRHFFTVAIESEGYTRHVPPDRLLEHYEIEPSEGFEKLRQREGGIVMVTAHLGDWEAGSSLILNLGFKPLYAIAKPARNRPLSLRIQRSRERRGIKLLARRGAMQDASKILEAGGTLAMLLDQRARKKPVMAPFFGRPARCDRSAGVLLRRLRVPVLVLACYRTGPYRYRMKFGRVLWPEELQGSSPEEISTTINAEFEALILEAPEQYFWLHDRYRGAPE